MNSFRPPFWQPGRHWQTILPALLVSSKRVSFKREIWQTPEGDRIAVDFLPEQSQGPMTVLFHGLEGSSKSHYAQRIMAYLSKHQANGCVIHFRGCGGLTNRLPRSYHSGDSTEIDWILRRLLAKYKRLRVIGVSLGGNALLKWLGEQGSKAIAITECCVAISAPLDLPKTGHILNHGFNRVYTRLFLNTLKPKALTLVAKHHLKLHAKKIALSKSLWDFDNQFTAPLHGFRDADDYWERCNCRPLLPLIQVPTLLINARNDPFLPESALPQAHEISPKVICHFPKHGGHVGFWNGSSSPDKDWLISNIFQFLETQAHGSAASL